MYNKTIMKVYQNLPIINKKFHTKKTKTSRTPNHNLNIYKRALWNLTIHFTLRLKTT